MSGNQKKSNPPADSVSTDAPKPAANADAGQAQLQKQADEAAAKGYYGTVPDETPNSAYTVAGVTKARKDDAR